MPTIEEIKKTNIYKRFRMRIWNCGTYLRAISSKYPIAEGFGNFALDMKEDINNLNNIAYKDFIINEIDFNSFQQIFDFTQYLNPYWSRYKRKVAEYYFVWKNLCLSRKGSDYTYVDAASSNSNWSEMLYNIYGINTYSIDLEPPIKKNNRFVQADVTNMPFENSSVDAISLQSALEVFPDDIDVRFVKEACRVLKPGGKIVISPLYLNKTYCNVYGWSYYRNAIAEKDATKCIRTDYDMPFTRLYDVKHLVDRIITPAEKLGCSATIFSVSMGDNREMVDNICPYIFFRFGLVLNRNI